jgi:methionine-R-sulfoxide reductase
MIDDWRNDYVTPEITMKHKIVAAVLLAGGLMPSAPIAQQPAQATKAATQAQQGYKRPSDAELKKKLTPIQFSVTRRDDTEMPFRNEYWDNHEAGIYVDVISGEPLFSSLDKYDSGTGWPSFTKPLEPKNIRTKTDFKIGYPRTEARSANADSHLGHIFDDGPKPAGLRYCMNSAAMRFVPVSRLEAEGYGKYVALFRKK